MNAKLGEDAFTFYASLPRERRSYAEVARRFGVCRGTVSRTAKQEGWIDRLNAIDQKAREQVDQEIAAQRAEINARHLKVARFLIGMGVQSLQSSTSGKPLDAAEILGFGVTLERQLTGVDTVESEIRIE